MIISDLIRRSKTEKIRIPFFHRAPISIMKTSKYTLVYFINKNSRVFNDDSDLKFEMPQLVITPIPFNDWPYLWKISISIREKPGIVREILRILNENKLNVLVETSYAVDLNQYHVIQLIVSASYYHGNIGQENDIPYRIRVVREQIQLAFLKELYLHNYSLDRSLEPAVYVRPITRYLNLYNLYHDLYETDQERQLYQTKKQFRDSSSFDVDEESKLLRSNFPHTVEFNLDQPFFGQLLQHNGYNPGETYKYIIHTQSSTQQMSIYFPQRSKEIYIARITHNDRIGAISSFVNTLSEGNFNLFSTLTRKLSNQESHFEFVYEYRGKVQRSEGDVFKNRSVNDSNNSTESGAIQKNIKDLENDYRGHIDEISKLLNEPRILSYRPKLFYPRSSGEWTDWEPVDISSGAASDKVLDNDNYSDTEDDSIRYTSEPPTQYDRDEHRQRVRNLIEELEQQLATTRNDGRRRADLKARLRFARNLELTATFAKPRVFVSYRFDETGENAVWFLRRVFEEHGFDIVIAKDLQNQYITDGVYGSIAQCHFWIGVLTVSSTDQHDKKPSPWIQWEYGIARAHPGIIERRLMSDREIELEKNLIFREVPRFRTDNVRHMQRDLEKIGKEFAISFRERWEGRFDNGC